MLEIKLQRLINKLAFACSFNCPINYIVIQVIFLSVKNVVKISAHYTLLLYAKNDFSLCA